MSAKQPHQRDATIEWSPADTSFSPASSEELPSARFSDGRIVGRFELVELIGRGGMGEVYRAVHVKLKKQVALKLLAPERLASEEARGRFHREIRLISGLSHPNIVRFENAGDADGAPFLAMEFVEGIGLDKLVASLGPLSIADACQLIGQACVGLHHAHRHGVVHRDLKPANLMLSTAGVVKVLDLGLARLYDSDLESLRASGPEQAANSRAVDDRADVYALGCALFSLLTGEAPFGSSQESSIPQILLARAKQSPPNLLNCRSDAPEALADLLTRMLAKSPEERPDAGEAAVALAPFAAGCDVLELLKNAGLIPAKDAETDSVHFCSAEYLTASASERTPAAREEPNAFSPHERSKGLSSSTTIVDFVRPRRRRRWIIPAIVAVLVPTLGVAGLFALRSQPPPTPVAAAPAVTLDWDDVSWPELEVVTRSFAFDDLQLTVSIEGEAPFDMAHDTPNDSAAMHGGSSPPEESLLVAIEDSSPGRGRTVMFEFSEPVKEVLLPLIGVDQSSAGARDRIKVTGSLQGEIRPHNLSTSSANVADVSGKIVRGAAASSEMGAGNVTVKFSEPIDRLALEYFVLTDDSSPGAGGFAIGDVAFASAKPFGSAYVLDWDKEQWRRRSRCQIVSKGPANVAFALTGDNAMKTKHWIANFSGDKRLVWQLMAPLDRLATTAMMAFSRPVENVSFALFEIAADSADAGSIRVGAVRNGRPVLIDGEREITVAAADLKKKSGFKIHIEQPVDKVLLSYTGAISADEADSAPKDMSRQISMGDIKFQPSPNLEEPLVEDLEVVVGGTANVQLAGRNWNDVDEHGNCAPSEAPIAVTDQSIAPGRALTFDVSGSVRERSGVLSRGPNGGAYVRCRDIESRVGALLGVFLSADSTLSSNSPAQPLAPLPERPGDCCPKLGEVFYIGDGRSAASRPKSFFVPDGARRLCLGVMDDGAWHDNVGAFAVRIQSTEKRRPRAEQGSKAQSVDLLSMIDVLRDCSNGVAIREGDAIIHQADSGQRSVLQVPAISPVEFVMRLSLERVAGEKSFAVGFSSGRGRMMALFDTVVNGQLMSGLYHSTGDSRSLVGQESTPRLPQGERVDIVIDVARDSVDIECDGETVAQFRGVADELRLNHTDEALYPEAIFLHSHDSSFRVTRWTIEPRRGELRRLPMERAGASRSRLAAERWLYRGGAVRLSIDGWRSRELTSMHDLPETLPLATAGARSSQTVDFRDRDVELLRGLQGLRELSLSKSQDITDKGMAAIGTIKSLESLSLSESQVTDAGLAHLADLTNLETLVLVNTNISDVGAAHLRSLKLRRVGLSGTQVGDQGLAALSTALKEADWLCLCSTQVSPKSLPLLASFSKLRTLHLGGMSLTDEDLPQLYPLMNLKSLRITSDAASEAAIEELARRLGKVKIDRE